MAPFDILKSCEHILKAQVLVRKHKNMSGNVSYMYKYLLNNTLCDFLMTDERRHGSSITSTTHLTTF